MSPSLPCLKLFILLVALFLAMSVHPEPEDIKLQALMVARAASSCRRPASLTSWMKHVLRHLSGTTRVRRRAGPVLDFDQMVMVRQGRELSRDCVKLVSVAKSKTLKTLSLSYHESRAIQSEEGYSADSPTSVESSSFVVQCTRNWFLFYLQTCQPVQCNSMPTMKYTSLMIRVGFVFQPYSLHQCMAAYSVDGTLGF